MEMLLKTPWSLGLAIEHGKADTGDDVDRRPHTVELNHGGIPKGNNVARFLSTAMRPANRTAIATAAAIFFHRALIKRACSA